MYSKFLSNLLVKQKPEIINTTKIASSYCEWLKREYERKHAECGIKVIHPPNLK